MAKNQHVVPHQSRWAVRSAGAKRVASVHERQSDAIEAARQTARSQQSELFIHNRQGQIRTRDSYGSDPCPPKG
ncbi:DUF2188 domain-containing protein [Bradyrhizobium sp. AUGA SZCCT0042]|uniref:DUF2188 domain-containing protein n=1 Tax=Bradyrhizobium sp. AUGA SZCCT0042 TaxID=2807651 RepID=UPI001BA8753A|nr:DUF2188 domain-containing protein [Bradyrhizobium sp. AUGA SZCCT0042]MBR1297381.1 DUF2188 domain-containing protein [Bradyrhizobium sp. AUGA SZCCT0042]